MTRPLKKLSEKYLRPYEIIAQPSLQFFILRLPDTIRAVYPVFHVSMLEPAIPNTFQQCSEPLPVPVVIDREPEYKISKIVDSKIDYWRACKLLYKIIWLGYKDTDNDSEWLPVMELEHAKELVNNFYLKYPSKLGPLRPWILAFYFLDSISLHSTHFKNYYYYYYEYLYTLWSVVSFALICLLVFCSIVSITIWYLYFRSSLCCKIHTLVFLHSFPLQ